jgi:hypothetical protein
MNNFIKQIIEEKFVSKKQQRKFYAQSQNKDLSKSERMKWKKMADEFSSKTNFDKLPEKAEETDIDEIVDDKGNIKTGKKPGDLSKKGITQRKTTDQVVKTGGGSMGIHGVHGTHTSLRYWAESDLSKTLGAGDTILKDVPYDDAKDHMEDDLGLEEPEAEKRLSQMGYDEELPNDQVRLVENPKKFIEEFIESILSNRSKENDIVNSNQEMKEINPIIKRQITSLKDTLKNNNLSVDDVLEYLKDNE